MVIKGSADGNDHIIFLQCQLVQKWKQYLHLPQSV
jgi:hypothetical protein